MWTPPSWQAGNWAASYWQRADELEEEQVVSGPAGGGGGGSFAPYQKLDMEVVAEFERFSIEVERKSRLAARAKSAKPKVLVDAVAKTLEAQLAAQQADLARMLQAQAKIREAAALAAKAIEDARRKANDEYNALMLALVLLDED